MAQMTPAERRAPAADVDEILRLHREWWEANVDADIPRMVEVFPSPGEEYLMFNFNGHPYYGMTEKVALWTWYRQYLEKQEGLDIRIMRMEVRGDTAWVASQGRLEPKALRDDGWIGDPVTSPLIRSTEIYHRDDGQGRPVWRMWHFHASPMAPLDDVRPGFDDTTRGRGLGWVPWTPLPVREP